MTFDVFGDFEERGYLQNTLGLKNLDEVKKFEHLEFLRNVDKVITHLEAAPKLTYQHVLDTHKMLFGEVYPWAGQDRAQTAPDKTIGKAGRFDLFSHPSDCRLGAEYALTKGQDPKFMRQRPGEVMGILAYAHPFLDGNGRTIMCVHSDLGRRANIHIDWTATDQAAYLKALTRELENPGIGQLEEYLKPFTKIGVAPEPVARQLSKLPSLQSSPSRQGPSIPSPSTFGNSRRRLR